MSFSIATNNSDNTNINADSSIISLLLWLLALGIVLLLAQPTIALASVPIEPFGLRSAKDFAAQYTHTTTGGIQEAINDCVTQNVDPCGIVIDSGYTATVDLTRGPPISVNIDGVYIFGFGFGDYGNIQVIGTGDVFDVTGQFFQLRNLAITITGTGSPNRTGSAIVHAAGMLATNGTIEDIRFHGLSSVNNGSIFLDDSPGAGGWVMNNIRIVSGTTWTSIASLLANSRSSTISGFFFSQITAGGAYTDAAFVFDGAIDTVQISDINIAWVNLGTGTKIWARNSFNVPVNPRWIECKNCNIETDPNSTAIRLDASRFFSYSGYVAGAGTGIAVGASARDTDLTHTIFETIYQNAVTVAAGAVNTNVSQNVFEDTGLGNGGNQYDTIDVPNGVTGGLQISDNFFSPYTSQFLPRYGIDIRGYSTAFSLLHNNMPLTAFGTAPILDGSPNQLETLFGNLGANDMWEPLTGVLNIPSSMGPPCTVAIRGGLILAKMGSC